MLVLKRKPGERIQLTCPDGTVIVILLSKVKEGGAAIAIDAPMSVKIDRGELESKLEKS